MSLSSDGTTLIIYGLVGPSSTELHVEDEGTDLVLGRVPPEIQTIIPSRKFEHVSFLLPFDQTIQSLVNRLELRCRKELPTTFVFGKNTIKGILEEVVIGGGAGNFDGIHIPQNNQTLRINVKLLN